MAVIARDLRKTFRDRGAQHVALNDCSLNAQSGQTLVVLGPSGAGKTTLLRVIAGFEVPDSGEVLIDNSDVTGLPAQSRKVALVFDRDALLPHLTVEENLHFAARLGAASDGAYRSRVLQLAGELGIAQQLRKKPKALSAGQRQRAALARALLSDPRALLLDEPFGHLDPQLRAQVRSSYFLVGRAFQGPIILVTHDHGEALLGERLAVMIDGRIQQCDAPQRVYDYPATLSVATFLGSPPMNLLFEEREVLGIRPEHIRVDEDGDLHGTIFAIQSTGADILLNVRTPKGEIVVRAPAPSYRQIGESVGLKLAPDRIRRFDRATGALQT